MSRMKKIIKTSILGIITNVLLVISKAIIGLSINSIALVLDAVNNLSDVLSSVITIIGIKLSEKKADKEHPYGHGRIEYLSSMIIVILILIAGVISLKESIIKIIYPVEIKYSLVSLEIIILAILLKLFIGIYYKHQGKKLDSNSLTASGVDALSDAIISISILIGALINIKFNVNLDGYLGTIISLFILKSAYEIMKETIDDMIGTQADNNLTKKLRRKIISYEEVLGVYDLMIHSYGPTKIIATAHIEVNEKMKAKNIDRLTRRISKDIYTDFGIILTIGIYASNDSDKYKSMYQYINRLCKKHSGIIQVHGFFVDEDINHVYFDIIFNFEETNTKKIVNEITNSLKEKYPKYNYCIVIDRDSCD